MCSYEEDEKNQKTLVGSGSLAETSVLFTITPIPRNSVSLRLRACSFQGLAEFERARKGTRSFLLLCSCTVTQTLIQQAVNSL